MANGTNDNKDLTKHDHHQMRDWPPLSLSRSFSLSVTVAIFIIFELYLFMYIQCTNSSRVNYSSNNFLFLAISNLLLSPPIEGWNCNYNLWGSHIHSTQLLFQKNLRCLSDITNIILIVCIIVINRNTHRKFKAFLTGK